MRKRLGFSPPRRRAIGSATALWAIAILFINFELKLLGRQTELTTIVRALAVRFGKTHTEKIKKYSQGLTLVNLVLDVVGFISTWERSSSSAIGVSLCA